MSQVVVESQVVVVVGLVVVGSKLTDPSVV